MDYREHMRKHDEKQRQIAAMEASDKAISEVIQFAKIRGGDCAALVSFVVLKETGMLESYMESLHSTSLIHSSGIQLS